MPAGFRRHLVGKTVSNAGYGNSAEIRFIGKLMNMDMDIFVNKLIQFYVNNSVNLRLLTQHTVASYTHKMAIVQ